MGDRKAAILENNSSWHFQYKDCPTVFVSGFPTSFSEGDLASVFEQFGLVTSVRMALDKETGMARGSCFIDYADSLSAVLAVDNFNKCLLGSRRIVVSHAAKREHSFALKKAHLDDVLK